MIHWLFRRRYRLAGVLGAAVIGALVAIPLLARQTASSASCPTRIVSISPTATESLYAIGAGNRVVAVDSDSNYPPSAPRKSGLIAYSPNAEAIAGTYNPDLVVVPYDANKVVEQLRALGIRVVYQPTAQTLAAAYAQIAALGAATCRTSQAAALVGTMQQQIATVSKAVGTRANGLTYYDEISGPPTIYAASSSSIPGQLLGLLGMRSIADSAAGAGSGFPSLSDEQVVKQSPQLIFLSDNQPADGNVSVASVGQRPAWSTISAVKNSAVYPLNDDAASRWGPRVVDLMRQIAADVTQYTQAHPQGG